MVLVRPSDNFTNLWKVKISFKKDNEEPGKKENYANALIKNKAIKTNLVHPLYGALCAPAKDKILKAKGKYLLSSIPYVTTNNANKYLL